MGVIDEGHELHRLRPIGRRAPGVFLGIEIETHHRAVILGGDGVAFAVTVNEVTAVNAIDYRTSLGNRIASAPELDGVEHQQVGKTCHLIHGKNPETEEHKLVDKLVANLLVPAEKLVGKGERADT